MAAVGLQVGTAWHRHHWTLRIDRSFSGINKRAVASKASATGQQLPCPMPVDGFQELELLRSDGDPKSWPSSADPDIPRRQGRYVATRLDEEASTQWRRKIGGHIAKHQGLPGTRKLSGFPGSHYYESWSRIYTKGLARWLYAFRPLQWKSARQISLR